MFLALLFACDGPAEADPCPDLPSSATAAPNVLGNEDDCGYWSVALGEQLVVALVVTEAESPCELESEEGLTLLYDPIYTNMSNDSPKWTFQVGAELEVEGASIQITCEEGTTWAAIVDVIPAE